MRLPTVREEREAFVTAPVDVAAAAPPQPSDERPRSSEPDLPEGSAVDVVRRLLFAVWSDWRLRIGIALAVSMVFGLVVGVWTPRGPLNSGQALASIGASLLVGAIAGVSMRSRWSMLLAPVVFAAVFELTRRSTNGTTVDAIHPGSTYGVLALVVGRGVHGIVSLAPMALAAAFGAGFARAVTGSPASKHPVRAKTGRCARRGGAALSTLALVALAVGIAQPATTAPIRGADGKTVVGSVAELTRVDIGGHQLTMMIRGSSADNPILLFLAGGPGGAEIGAMRNYLGSLEDHFLVVTWDQRGTGKSYDQIDPIATVTFDNALADTTAVTRYLRRRFGHDTAKVYLVGNSYGTILGVRAVQQHPEMYAAFVGTGQMVSVRETDQRIYADTLGWARSTGNRGVVDTLTASGPPPYTNILDYEPALSYLNEVYPYDHTPNAEGVGGFSENIRADEYTLVDEAHLFAGFLDTFTAIYPQLQDIDLRVDATRLEVPVYLVEGAHEVPGRSDLAKQWFAMLQAPRKELVEFATSGHRPLFEQPHEFTAFMTDTVLAQSAASP